MAEQTLNIEKQDQLIQYLQKTGLVGSNESLSIRTLLGGVSNRTVLVKRSCGEAWVLKQALHKLKVQTDWFSDPKRIEREALGIEWLNRLAPPGSIPKLIFLDPENHLLAMEAVPEGHENWKVALLKGKIDSLLISQFADLLAGIQKVSAKKEKTIRPLFQERCFFKSLRLDPYYLYTAEQLPSAKDFMTYLIERTHSRSLTLVHGDYSPKNVLVYRKQLILLDHEVIHFGDPCFDVGFSMTHFLSKANYLPEYRRRFQKAAHDFWQSYSNKVIDQPWAQDLENYAIHHTLGCLLARVAGRSPLEYLDLEARHIQQTAALDLIQESHDRMDILIDNFIHKVST
jgi:5-methylthioribose kinase